MMTPNVDRKILFFFIDFKIQLCWWYFLFCLCVYAFRNRWAKKTPGENQENSLFIAHFDVNKMAMNENIKPKLYCMCYTTHSISSSLAAYTTHFHSTISLWPASIATCASVINKVLYLIAQRIEQQNGKIRRCECANFFFYSFFLSFYAIHIHFIDLYQSIVVQNDHKVLIRQMKNKINE